jgi:hypothetical protein
LKSTRSKDSPGPLSEAVPVVTIEEYEVEIGVDDPNFTIKLLGLKQDKLVAKFVYRKAEVLTPLGIVTAN